VTFSVTGRHCDQLY